MSDVAIQPFPSEPIRNGVAITAADKSGNYQRVVPTIPENLPNVSGIFTSLRDRFDNTAYYST